LSNAEFLRHGQMHRNTYINAPRLLKPTLQFRRRDDLFFAGQITGVEGYVGNIGTGWLAGVNAARLLKGESLLVLPQTTMLGALCWYVTHAEPSNFEPMKANYGILPPLDDPPRGKRERAAAYSERALRDLAAYIAQERVLCDAQQDIAEGTS
jgi:methylenetetrahydrofolate--tRNA-(uracil-5-)-methyltransferase